MCPFIKSALLSNGAAGIIQKISSKYLPLFLDQERPSPDKGRFKQWKSLLSEKAKYNDKGNFLNFYKKTDFGTVSSSIIAIRSTNQQFADKNSDNIWLFSNGAPNSNNYKKINII